MRRRSIVPAAVALGTALLAGCHTDMYEQPKARPLEAATFFADGSSSRTAPDDTVARGRGGVDEFLASGKERGKDAGRFPFPVTRAVLARGRERYDIFCSPCHGRLGDGQGMVVARGFKPPPSFHTDRMRSLPVGHVVDVIANGFGAMYDYRERIGPRDRWAIAAYVRALQLSQHATTDDVPPAELSRLEREAR